MFNFRLPSKLRRDFRRQCREQKRSMSIVARMLFENWLKEGEKRDA